MCVIITIKMISIIHDILLCEMFASYQRAHPDLAPPESLYKDIMQYDCQLIEALSSNLQSILVCLTLCVCGGGGSLGGGGWWWLLLKRERINTQ